MAANTLILNQKRRRDGLVWLLALAFGLGLLVLGLSRLGSSDGGWWSAFPLLVEGGLVLTFCLYRWLGTAVRVLVLLVLVYHCNDRVFRLQAVKWWKLLLACLPARLLLQGGGFWNEKSTFFNEKYLFRHD